MSTEDAPQTKLEEQSKSKGELSYSYWVGNGAANSSTAPVKIAEGAAVGQQAAAAGEAQPAEGGASAWNAAGTFEERDVSEWAKKRLAEMVVGTSSGSGSGGVSITACKSVSGHANIWFIRGKKRAGFDFENLELAFSAAPPAAAGAAAGSPDGDPAAAAAAGDGVPRGTIKVPSASPDDLDDLQLEVALDGGGSWDAAAGSAALAAARGLRQPLQQVLEALLAELREK